MRVHLIDGTYELFRHFYALPSRQSPTGQEVAAAVGVVRSCLKLVDEGATHLGVATDTVIESFRNDLWPDYKTGEGIDPALYSQFPLVEELLAAAGFVVWPMVELEADDALASAAALAKADPRVTQVIICTPDKDLAQVVDSGRVIQLDRRKQLELNDAAVVAKFGVPPRSIPDYLALVGDAQDGFPGLPGFGAKSAGALLSTYGSLEHIPARAEDWKVTIRGAAKLAQTLVEQRERALLFRRLATLRSDAKLFDNVDQLAYAGPLASFASLAARLGVPKLAERP